jgi:hypothetical protein
MGQNTKDHQLEFTGRRFGVDDLYRVQSLSSPFAPSPAHPVAKAFFVD